MENVKKQRGINKLNSIKQTVDLNSVITEMC